MRTENGPLNLITWGSLVTLTRAVSVRRIGEKMGPRKNGRSKTRDSKYKLVFCGVLL